MSFHLPASKFYPYEPDPLALDCLERAKELAEFVELRYDVKPQRHYSPEKEQVNVSREIKFR